VFKTSLAVARVTPASSHVPTIDAFDKSAKYCGLQSKPRRISSCCHGWFVCRANHLSPLSEKWESNFCCDATELAFALICVTFSEDWQVASIFTCAPSQQSGDYPQVSDVCQLSQSWKRSCRAFRNTAFRSLVPDLILCYYPDPVFAGYGFRARALTP
jgi:hypothetical protein